MTLRILAKCPQCDASLPVAGSEAPARIACGQCGREMGLAWSDSLRGDRRVDHCPICEGRDFYIRKDFDPKIGLSVVSAGALVSAAFYWLGRDLVAYGILAGAALIDLVVYSRLGDVTVCYRCHSEFRGDYVRTAAPFDLHTADVLELEYERRIKRR